MAELLKNVYTKDYIRFLAQKVKENYCGFDEKAFIKSIFDNSWTNLELKQRMHHIAINLNKYINLDYKNQLEVLKIVSKDFYSFEAMFFQEFVEVYGLDDFDNSMKALEVFTIESSSEFAIRAFILNYEDKTMNQLKIWAKSSNEHIRRLSCEGCRPRLPWGVSLASFKKEPSKVLEIIEILKNDESEYVRKSVANNLNDISKDNENQVINFVKKNLGKTKELDWICKHGSRTLLKQGNKKILKLFGFIEYEHIKVEDFIYTNELQIGESLEFCFLLKSNKSLGNLRVEYAIDYVKANGNLSKKIFMISQNEIKQNIKKFSKKQSFKNMTTRKHYSGKHYISIIVNGKEKEKRSFFLNDTSD